MVTGITCIVNIMVSRFLAMDDVDKCFYCIMAIILVLGMHEGFHLLQEITWLLLSLR